MRKKNMPTPYDTLIEAVSRLQVSGVVPADIKRFSEAELRALLEPNLAAYEQARAALQEKPRLTEDIETLGPEKLQKDRSRLYNLSRFLIAGASLAELQGDFAEVSRAGLCQFELAHAIRSGGNPNDFLISLACRTTGISCLRKVRDRIDNTSRREAIRRLVEWEKDLLPPIGPFNLSPHRKESASDTIDTPSKDDAPIPVDPFHGRILALSRMLVIDLALRSFREAEGRYPERLTALETILPEGIPLDPFTEAPFAYRREGNHAFHLYSLGPSGIDHGGIYGGISAVEAGQADLCLDVVDYADPR